MKNIEKCINKIINSYIFWILIVCVIIYLPMIDGVSMGHDSEFHLTNMEMLMQRIYELNIGAFGSKIFGVNIVRGFGYGTFLFYPCLSYFLTASIGVILSILGIQYSLSISYSLILIAFLSGISMYCFMKKIYKDNMIAFLCSVLYVTSTYFLCDAYVRTAIAEDLVFLFIPIIFSALYELFYGNKYQFYLLFIVGYIGIINSHLVLSIYITLFIIILLLINYKKFLKIDIIKKLCVASLVVLLVCSPYLITVLEHKFLGNYVVFDNFSMFSDMELKYNALDLYDYFYISTKTSNGIVVYFNYVTLLCLILIIINNKKIFPNKEDKKIYNTFLILTLITMFVSSKYFPWEKVPTFMKNIQFPWRLCTFIHFSVAALSGSVLRLIKNTNKKPALILIVIAVLLFTINTISANKDYYYLTGSEDYNYNIGHQKEYMPSNMIKNYAYYENREQGIYILKGNGSVTVVENDTPNLLATIDLNSDELELELPRIYYLGYNIKLTDNNNNVHKINYSEDNNGFIKIKVKNSGTLSVSYTGSTLTIIFNYIASFTLIIFFAILMSKFRKEELKK